MTVHDCSDSMRWDWKVKTDYLSTERRLSFNAGNASNNRVADAVDRDIWIMKNIHGQNGATFLVEWRLTYESALPSSFGMSDEPFDKFGELRDPNAPKGKSVMDSLRDRKNSSKKGL